MSQPASKPNPGRIVRAACILTMLAAALACVVLAGCGSSTLGQSEQSFKDAFVSQGLDVKGAASNDFVKETPYAMSAFSIGSIEKQGDDKATAEAKVTVENESFTSEMVYKCTYTDSKDNPSYTFDFLSAETTPKKGIDFDSQRQLYDCDSVLSDDKASCTVVVDDMMDAWFVESENSATYTYEFDGSKWRFKDEDEARTVKYKEIEGNYAAKSGNAAHFSKFEISELDANKGTFTIAFSTEEYARGTVTMLPASGTMQAAIEPTKGGNEALPDGYSYAFEASGTSDSGMGQAKLKGYFTTNSTGEKTIVFQKGGYISSNSLWNGTAGNPNFEVDEGTMYKQ